ncbi:hypothetical protein BO71DRAFT_174292 [Aspergillus ellipticus CBS 707.79]|uniref:Uncharacterized protein n=1 Tax=Aspergillus ellipticus CBS 707.79 TaxID=1448320 RepID=A0A319DGG2_9EURO|nr:hypothetical protein BO71DRAFT_174292 [Aspergillus ellipticus CBS 707.79]
MVDDEEAAGSEPWKQAKGLGGQARGRDGWIQAALKLPPRMTTINNARRTRILMPSGHLLTRPATGREQETMMHSIAGRGMRGGHVPWLLSLIVTVLPRTECSGSARRARRATGAHKNKPERAMARSCLECRMRGRKGLEGGEAAVEWREVEGEAKLFGRLLLW